LLTFPDTSSSAYKLKVLRDLSDSLVSLNGFDQVLSSYQLEALKPVLSPKALDNVRNLIHLYFPSLDSNCEMIYLRVLDQSHLKKLNCRKDPSTPSTYMLKMKYPET